MKAANGVIVASSLKRHGKISEAIDPIRVAHFVEAARKIETTDARIRSQEPVIGN
jgi:predicted TIM-barrel enzyme